MSDIPQPRPYDSIRAIRYRDGVLELLDQRLLPRTEQYVRYRQAAEVVSAVQDLVVRGAPAIGITVAYGAVISARNRLLDSGGDWLRGFDEDLERLRGARPTAVNASWAAAQMHSVAHALPEDPIAELTAVAERIHHNDVAANYRIGELGAELLPAGSTVLTHCNAGSLATGGYGTALGIIRAGAACRRLRRVLVDETRPWLQGARLTAWELVREGIPADLISDAAAAWLIRRGEASAVVVGADRIAANGDVANKIGTYGLALAARASGVPFIVAAPTSTIDAGTARGEDIEIERRDPAEVLTIGGVRVAAEGVGAENPVFDVTPAGLITAIVTEAGVISAPDRERIAACLAGSGS